jgi:hypothetical protein
VGLAPELIAIALMPPVGKYDWALGNYSALGDVWQRELETIVGRHVSLEAIVSGNDADMCVRRCGRLLHSPWHTRLGEDFDKWTA